MTHKYCHSPDNLVAMSLAAVGGVKAEVSLFLS
jgi:hypothetical protein